MVRVPSAVSVHVLAAAAAVVDVVLEMDIHAIRNGITDIADNAIPYSPPVIIIDVRPIRAGREITFIDIGNPVRDIYGFQIGTALKHIEKKSIAHAVRKAYRGQCRAVPERTMTNIYCRRRQHHSFGAGVLLKRTVSNRNYTVRHNDLRQIGAVSKRIAADGFNTAADDQAADTTVIDILIPRRFPISKICNPSLGAPCAHGNDQCTGLCQLPLRIVS